MKITVCDNCHNDERKIFFTKNGIDFCKDCYYQSKFYKPTEMEEYYGHEMGQHFNDCKGVASWDYKDYESSVQEEMEKALKSLGVKPVVKMTPDGYYIGFKPI